MEVDCYSSPSGRTPTKYHKSPRRSEKKRQQLFKTPPPKWLKNYRERCIDELNTRRHHRQTQLIENFRKIDLNEEKSKDEIIAEVMRTVWRESVEPNFDDEETRLADGRYHHYLKEIENELLINENNYWQSLSEQITEEEIAWSVENRNRLVCLRCRLAPLKPLTSVGFNCANCNFHLEVPIDEEQLYTRMNEVIEQHSWCCNQIFDIIPLARHGVTVNVQFNCSNCNYCQLLLCD